MAAIALMFAVAGALPLQPEALPAAPFDVAVGHQQVVLREAMIAQGHGARLVLFVRAADRAGFEAGHPAGSITAHLTDAEGREHTLEHTGYTYYRGFAGLVLTEQAPADRQTRYGTLALDALVPLAHVRAVWLDRDAKRVEDLRPAL